MKKFTGIPTIILALSFIAFIVWFFFIRIHKIAYVDASKILQEYKGAVEARKELETKGQQWQANIDTLSADLQRSISSYEKSGGKNDADRKKIEQQQDGLNRYRQAIHQNASEEEAKVTQEVVGKINDFIKSYGKDKRYKLILIASQVGTIAYAEEAMDITPDVLQKLNDQYQSKKTL